MESYQFKSLEHFTRAEAMLLNRAFNVIPESETIASILNAISATLVTYDICNWENLEIGLIVKPAGGAAAPQFHRFPQALVTIGRTTDNDVSLKSPLVSKKHAEITLRGTDYFLKDLRSNNGTLLNDVKISSGSDVVLKNDDIIKIEPFEVVVGLASDITKKPLSIALHSISVTAKPSAAGRIAVFCRTEPDHKRTALLLDRASATWMIRKIITGHKETPDAQWTEIEEGLLGYLVIKVLSRINPFLQNTGLVLEGIEKDEKAIESFFAEEGALVESTFGAKTEKGMVYAYSYLPESILAARATTSSTPDLIGNIQWMAALPYTFAIHVGASVLSSDQIPLLEEGDIILLDRTSITMEGTIPKGKVELRCRRWPLGVISGSLGCDETGNSSITVEAIFQEGMKRMAEASKKGEAKQDASSEALGGIEVPVNVEFARLNFTLEEISSFKEGQIIEFEKGQPEMVDLSVDGKIIANGKLVDVEGKPGVRILKIIKTR